MTAPKIFIHSEFQAILNRTVASIQKLSDVKGGEYAGDVDRLANFRRNADNLELTMEDIWSVYAGKHWDAINQYIKDKRKGKTRPSSEPIAGRVDDLILYCVLFKAMLAERGEQV